MTDFDPCISFLQERNSITKDGYYVVTSDKTRKQMLNQADCMDKVRYMIRQAAVKPYEPTESEIEVMHKRYPRISLSKCKF